MSTGRPLRVVAHNGASVFGGCEKAVSLLLAGLQERGHDVTLLCGHPVVAEGAEAMGVRTAPLRLGGDAVLTDALGMARTLRRIRPDAVVLTTFRKTWLGALGARLAGARRVVLRIGLSSDVPDGLKYRLPIRRWVDRVVVNADDMHAPFLAGVPGLDPAKIATVYKGIEAPRRTRERGALRRELGLASDAPLVGAIGRLVRQKRFDRLLEAVARLPEEVHCVVAGDGERRGELEAAADALGLAGRVRFLGFRSDLGDLLDALDLLVVSSDHEGMCNVMLEAMAAGVPVVSTPVAGAAEALEPGDDGVAPGLVVPFDAAALAGAVREVLGDAGLRRRMAAAGPRRVAERFGYDRMLEQWEAVLRGDRP